ncbi:MAG: ATPase [Clostridiales Family XIII bacterium]|jgi:sugar (pentulose or hexulose) kinase|nr:ATPase [Clostridiales Family XIII bacterium]
MCAEWNIARQTIEEGRTSLGVELGSTRIKAVLIGADHQPLGSGSFEWENRFENGVWTYRLEDVWSGIQNSFRSLSADIRGRYDAELRSVGSIGVSAMMHGYLVFDADGNQLVPFRTWRNTSTERASAGLTDLFRFNIPQRWSVAHLGQAILNKESHVGDIAFMTTLAGYVHMKLTGQKVLGIGDAAGMFPVDGVSGTYNGKMLARFDEWAEDLNFGRKLKDILPRILTAGETAGVLTPEGARLLDPDGLLAPGAPLCPPEGDAGTGMVATNSIAERTGNISAGTSIFAMAVLEKELSAVYKEIDMVTTPTGRPVAMVHCNNCTSDLDAWVGLFDEVTRLFGCGADKSGLYDMLYRKALEGEADCGGLLSCNYLSGEPITDFGEGRPLFARMPESRFTLGNFMRCLLFAAMGTIKIGMDILTEKEQVRLEQLMGHGGLFKVKDVGQRLMASALRVPVTVMETAGEGGAWGIALLAAYMRQRDAAETLEAYLSQKVFAESAGVSVRPEETDTQGFLAFMRRYREGLAIERTAVEHMK